MSEEPINPTDANASNPNQAQNPMQGFPPFVYQQPLPNATASLILGILSILGCCFYGIVGLILAIIALVLANKDRKMYALNPSVYSLSSYQNTNAGRICAIIGLSLSVLVVFLYMAIIAMFGFAVLSNPETIKEILGNMQ